MAQKKVIDIRLSLLGDVENLLTLTQKSARNGTKHLSDAQTMAKTLNSIVKQGKDEYAKLEDYTIQASKKYGEAKKMMDALGVDIKNSAVYPILMQIEEISKRERKNIGQAITEIKNGIDNRL